MNEFTQREQIITAYKYAMMPLYESNVGSATGVGFGCDKFPIGDEMTAASTTAAATIAASDSSFFTASEVAVISFSVTLDSKKNY